MVTKIIEPEVQQALNCIKRKKNFILTGGAGSGKTYSLISLIEEIGERYPAKSIVCITYTNNAVAEIRSRITNSKLYVSTIHEFIWSIIKKYQNEIKETLVELINDEEQNKFKYPKDFAEEVKIDIEYFSKSKIKYDENYSLSSEKNSIISHDHILIVAERMFEKYLKICDILKDIADFIFVDEYQDTNPLIKNILLTHIKKSSKENIVGFFGDSMQAIYDTGVGSISDNSLVAINKVQNRRNPETVINLANKIRYDNIEQKPSEDPEAPNMIKGKVIQGDVKFFYSENTDEVEKLHRLDYFKDWDFSNSKETKELWLVHKSNAKMAGFSKLYELYNSDLILDLISRIRIKINKGDLILTSETFEEIAEKADIEVRNRGKLLENIKNNKDYSAAYDWIKDKKWEDVCDFRINKDSLLSYKFNGLSGKYEAKYHRDKILQELDTIYELMELYKNKKYNDFLRRSNIKIEKIENKQTVNKKMNELFDETISISELIKKAKLLFNFCTDSFDNYILNQKTLYLWERIRKMPFSEYVHSIEYQKEYLPFATQHSVKGSEFDNVLVVLDNGNWTHYNFKAMFERFDFNESVVERTKKLFYVCCTRAKRRLVVFMANPDNETLVKVRDLFGKDNVKPIKALQENDETD